MFLSITTMYFTEEIITKWYLGKYNKGRAVALRRCARNIQFDGTLIIAVCVWQPRTHHARFFSSNSIDCNPSKKPAFWNSTFLFENPFLWRVFQVTSWYLYVYRFVKKRTIFIFCYRTNKWISYTASSLKHFCVMTVQFQKFKWYLLFDVMWDCERPSVQIRQRKIRIDNFNRDLHCTFDSYWRKDAISVLKRALYHCVDVKFNKLSKWQVQLHTLCVHSAHGYKILFTTN